MVRAAAVLLVVVAYLQSRSGRACVCVLDMCVCPGYVCVASGVCASRPVCVSWCVSPWYVWQCPGKHARMPTLWPHCLTWGDIEATSVPTLPLSSLSAHPSIKLSRYPPFHGGFCTHPSPSRDWHISCPLCFVQTTKHDVAARRAAGLLSFVRKHDNTAPSREVPDE